MKYLFTALLIIGVFVGCKNGSTTNDFKCSCAKIGLNNSWADSNKISCYLIPVSTNSLKPSDKKKFFGSSCCSIIK